MDLLTGKTVIVTGAAHGIGAAIVEEFLLEDARVVVNGGFSLTGPFS